MSKTVYFGTIFNFADVSAKKLHNSSYLEALTGLLIRVASNIRTGTDYLFDSGFFVVDHSSEPNCSYDEFVGQFLNTFLYDNSGGIHIIRGCSGIGKTLFFENGVQKLTYNKEECKGKYIKLGVDFAHIDRKKDIDFYEQMIYCKLNKNARDAIESFDVYNPGVRKEFRKKYDELCGNTTPYTNHEFLFPVMFFCQKIYSTHNKKPCIIIFDNIDLSCVETQRNVFHATVKICKVLKNYMKTHKCDDQYRVFFAMRPETFYRSGDIISGAFINFPLPNILKISVETIKNSLIREAAELDCDRRLSCEVGFHNILENKRIEVNTFSDVANYFADVLDHYLVNLWQGGIIERLGKSEEFHCNIVNYNVRKFLTFFADVLSNGGFKPLTKEFNEKPSNYTVFDYIEMIIRGRWTVHPGNKLMDGEGGNATPLIFNLFDASLWHNTQDDKIMHFMLNIRILQYFVFNNDLENVKYSDLRNCLSAFYRQDHIMKGIQKLVYVGIIYSFFDGDTVASKRNYDEITIEDNVRLRLSQTGKFYIVVSEKVILFFSTLIAALKKGVTICKGNFKNSAIFAK